MPIVIHTSAQPQVMCLLSPGEAGKSASLVDTGSWLLGHVTVTPRAPLRIPSWQGTSQTSQPCLSVCDREQTRGGHGCPRSQSPGGGGTVEKLSTREPGRHTGQTQLSGSRVRGMGQPHSLSFHPWGAEAEGQLLRACLGLSSAEHKCRTSSGYIINCLQATEPEGALCPRKRGSHPPPSGSPTPLRRKCLESA